MWRLSNQHKFTDIRVNDLCLCKICCLSTENWYDPDFVSKACSRNLTVPWSLQDWATGQRDHEGYGGTPHCCPLCAQRGLQVLCRPARLHQSTEPQQRSLHSNDRGLYSPQKLPSKTKTWPPPPPIFYSIGILCCILLPYWHMQKTQITLFLHASCIPRFYLDRDYPKKKKRCI